MKKLIKQQQDKIIAELCQKIIARNWCQKLIDETPEDIKNIDDIELITDEETKEIHKNYEQDLKNLNTNKLHIEADVFAYKALNGAEKEIKELLCIK